MKNVMRRIISLALCLCLLAMCLPLAPEVSAAEGPALVNVPTSIQWEASGLDGSSVTQDTAKGKTQVLVFFNALGGCSNSDGTLQGILDSGWIENENVQVTAIGCDGSNGTVTEANFKSYLQDKGFAEKGNLRFAWDSGNFSTVMGYLQAAGAAEQDANSFTYAVNVILDAAGNLRAAWMGAYRAGYYAAALSQLGVEGIDDLDNGLCTLYVPGTVDYDAAYETLALLNEYRIANGVSKLTMDESLLEAAMLRAAETAVFFSHTRPDGSSCFTVSDLANRENIAAGYADAEAVMVGWSNSSGHNANMLAADNCSVGIGCFRGKGGALCWVQLFSSRTGAAPVEIPTGSVDQTFAIPAAPENLDLLTTPDKLDLKPGETAQVTLRNGNLNYSSSNVQINAETVASSDETVVKAFVNNDGTVTVTAAGPGAAVVRLGVGELTAQVSVAVSGPFTDVVSGAYYEAAVNWASSRGIASGLTSTTFGPGELCTRAQFVTFLWRSQGKPLPKTTENPFVDVDSKAYYYNAVLWAVENGIVYGTDADRFSPDIPVTRGQAVTFLWRHAGKPEVTSQTNFTDVSGSAFYCGAVQWGQQESIVYGTSENKFSPNDTCIRAQTVTFLYRYLK